MGPRGPESAHGQNSVANGTRLPLGPLNVFRSRSLSWEGFCYCCFVVLFCFCFDHPEREERSPG